MRPLLAERLLPVFLSLVVATTAFARAGGSDGIGGDAEGSRRATIREVYVDLSVSRNIVERVLMKQSLLARNDYYRRESFHLRPDGGKSILNPKLEAAYAKIFPASGEDVFAELARTRIEVRLLGACTDHRGHSKDATAIGSDPGAMCFSAERLHRRLKSTELARELPALVIHELSHRMGTSEEEAVALQNAVRASIRSNDFDELNSAAKSDVRSEAQSLRETFARIETALLEKSPDLWATCEEIQSFSHALQSYEESVFGRTSDQGFMSLRLEGLRSLRAAIVQTALGLNSFCTKTPDPENFGQNFPLARLEFATMNYGPENGSIVRAEFQDVESARRSLAELRPNLERLSTNLPRFEDAAPGWLLDRHGHPISDREMDSFLRRSRR